MMHRVSIFDAGHSTLEAIREILDYDASDRISCTLSHNYGSIKVCAKALTAKDFVGTASGKVSVNDNEAQLTIDSNMSLFSSAVVPVHSDIAVSGFVRSDRAVPDRNIVRFMPHCRAAIIGCHKHTLATSRVGLGIKKNRVVCAMGAVSTNLFDGAADVSMNETGNVMNIALMVKQLLFVSTKVDVSMKQRHGVKAGLVHRWSSGSCIVEADLSRQTLTGGVCTDASKHARVAALAKYDWPRNELTGEIGALMRGSAQLRGNVNHKGRTECLVSLTPREWITTAFKSVTTPASRPFTFPTVAFSWSLDFHMNV